MVMNSDGATYYFSEDWILEHLVDVDGMWHVDYAGHESAGEVFDLFGDTRIVVPFTAAYPKREVARQLVKSMNRGRNTDPRDGENG